MLPRSAADAFMPDTTSGSLVGVVPAVVRAGPDAHGQRRRQHETEQHAEGWSSSAAPQTTDSSVHFPVPLLYVVSPQNRYPRPSWKRSSSLSKRSVPVPVLVWYVSEYES